MSVEIALQSTLVSGDHSCALPIWRAVHFTLRPSSADNARATTHRIRYTDNAALQGLPDETVIDGEIVALDESGHPSFNMLQNFGSSSVPLFYYVFDLLVWKSRELRSEHWK
jgi:hypothetical protein